MSGMERIRDIAKNLMLTPELQNYDKNSKAYIASVLATEIWEDKLTMDGIGERIKTIIVPIYGTVDVKVITEEDIEKMPINEKIEYYYKVKNLTPREIMRMVGKTYTRVKNIIKKIRERDQ